jgi:hypothetical protein
MTLFGSTVMSREFRFTGFPSFREISSCFALSSISLQTRAGQLSVCHSSTRALLLSHMSPFDDLVGAQRNIRRRSTNARHGQLHVGVRRFRIIQRHVVFDDLRVCSSHDSPFSRVYVCPGTLMAVMLLGRNKFLNGELPPLPPLLPGSAVQRKMH